MWLDTMSPLDNEDTISVICCRSGKKQSSSAYKEKTFGFGDLLIVLYIKLV